MVLSYYRLGRFEDARRSMLRLLTFAEKFRLDNPLVKRGSDVYQPNQPVNLTYDAFGPPAAFLRGLFEYLYRADGLVLVPHIPPGITELEQLDPVRFGAKKIYLSVSGRGPVTDVRINGRKWKRFDAQSIVLPYGSTPDGARVSIRLGDAGAARSLTSRLLPAPVAVEKATETWRASETGLARVVESHRRLVAARLGEGYEAAHAKLVLDCARVAAERRELSKAGKLHVLPEATQAAAEKLYGDTVAKLCTGLEATLKSYQSGANPAKREVFKLWQASETAPQARR